MVKKYTKSIYSFILILFISFLGYKFIYWNFYKVNYFFKTIKKVSIAEPAVNLSIISKGKKIFARGFSSKKNNIYIIKDLNIREYIKQKIEIKINNKLFEFNSYSYEKFIIININSINFIFTNTDLKLEEFLKIKKLTEKGLKFAFQF